MLVSPPGARLVQVARFLLTRDAYRLHVEPVIENMRAEYCDALASNNPWHARWISARAYLLIVPACLYGAAASLIKRMFLA